MRPIIILVLALLCLSTYAQSGILDQKVSLRYDNVSLEKVLQSIRKSYGIKFSYIDNVIPLNQKVSLRIKNQPLRAALDELFKGLPVSYQQVGDQVVLKYDAGKAKSEIQAPEPEWTNPYPVRYASLKTLRNYRVQPVFVSSDQPSFQAPPPPAYQYTAKDLRWQKWLKLYMARVENFFQSAATTVTAQLATDSVRAMHDSLRLSDDDPYWNYAEKDAQVTLITPLGSNGINNLNTVNHFSFNAWIGASAALEGLEFGGLVNAERDYVHGTQFAGLANVVRNNVKGAQFAGLANVSGGSTEGMQAAGLSNVVLKDSRSVQLAGLANIVLGDNHAPQLAGLVNVTQGLASGAQVAGLVNVAAEGSRAIQLAGLVNVANRYADGGQVAGLANVTTQDVQGIQLAGLFNRAGRVFGSQIGLINVADSVSGATIGFLSIVRKGYKSLDIWGSEALYGNIAFKTGTRRFYNILALGFQPRKGFVRWGVGYGVGTEGRLSNHLRLNLEAIAYQINENEWWTSKLNMLNQAKLTLGIRLSEKTYLALGPTFNVQVSRLYNADIQQYGTDLAPWHFHDKTTDDTNVRLWVGFHACGFSTSHSTLAAGKGAFCLRGIAFDIKYAEGYGIA